MNPSFYEVDFAPRVEDQLKKIPKNFRDLILDRIEKLAQNPWSENIEPLQGSEKGFFRIRQGDYRIIYNINDKKLRVLIVRVAHRREVYTKKHSK